MVPAAGEKGRQDARDEGPEGRRRAPRGEARHQTRRRRRGGRSSRRPARHRAPRDRGNPEDRQVRSQAPPPGDAGEGQAAGMILRMPVPLSYEQLPRPDSITFEESGGGGITIRVPPPGRSRQLSAWAKAVALLAILVSVVVFAMWRLATQH